MAQSKIPHLVKKGNGWYWQPSKTLRDSGWKSRPLGKALAAAEQRARKLNAEVSAGLPADVAAARPANLQGLIQHWQQSPHFQGVRLRTQRDYLYRCRVVADWCGEAELEDLNRGLVKAWHKACHQAHPAKANRALAMLKMLYEYAIDHEFADTNPADKVRPLPAPRQQVQDWTAAQLAHMIATADANSDGNDCPLFSIGTALALNEWMAQRLTDVLLMEASDIQNGVWDLTQSKTGARVWLPIGLVPGLTARLAEQQRRNAALGYQGNRILISEATGRVYFDEAESTDHFQRRFNRVRAIASQTMPSCAGLVFQKLRRFATTEAEDAGATEGGLNSVGGWRDNSKASTRYRARTLHQAETVFEARLAARRGQLEAGWNFQQSAPAASANPLK